MEIGFKTLVIIDNTESVGDVNLSLCKETAKYVCSNLCASDGFSIAALGEDVSYICDYTQEETELTAAIESVELNAGKVAITDNLTEIVADWKESDLALRNIILFTSGEELEPVKHDEAELYYLLKDAGYPVFVVQCVESRQDSARKNLSAISTISGGKLLLTEFENSDAASEKTMGDEIIQHIESIRSKELENVCVEENTVEAMTADAMTSEVLSEETPIYISSDKSLLEEDSMGSYETSTLTSVDDSPIIKSTPVATNKNINLIIPIISLSVAIIFATVLTVLLVLRNRRSISRDKNRHRYDDMYDIEGIMAEEADDYDCETRHLEDECSETRLLSSECIGHDIVLEDCMNPTRLFRVSCVERLIIGRNRNKCDVVIDYDDSVSGKHCELSVKDNCWYVRDLQSSNGTRVNHQKVFQELLLSSGDILQLGQLKLQVRL